jgi:preprotein translocase subunit SecE
LLRSLGVLVALGLAAVVALQSMQGQSLWKFIQAARIELRKVVWPTREETIQTTIAVMVFALIMGVFFWLLDLFLLYVSSKITGQGGL